MVDLLSFTGILSGKRIPSWILMGIPAGRKISGQINLTLCWEKYTVWKMDNSCHFNKPPLSSEPLDIKIAKMGTIV